MRGEQRWRSNLQIVGPPAAEQIPLPTSRSIRRASEQRLSELPIGSSVVLVATAPRAGRHCKAVAGRARVAVERSYLAFPSAEAPAYLVEDEAASIRVFLKNILVAPPRHKLSLPMLAAVRILRSLGTPRTVRALAPGRVVIGRRV